jgi:hypothetical protein
MPSSIELIGTPAAVTAAINAMVGTNHPGMATCLAQAQTAALGQVNSYPSAAALYCKVNCHHDINSATITIIVQPATVAPTNAIAQMCQPSQDILPPIVSPITPG